MQPDIAHPCCDQLTAVKKEYPLTSTNLTGSRTSYKFSNDRRLKFNFFKCIRNELSLWAALIKFWFQTDLGRENWASFYRYSREGSCFRRRVWPTREHGESNFYSLIGQNLKGELMLKIYATSGNLFTDSCRLAYKSSSDFFTSAKYQR